MPIADAHYIYIYSERVDQVNIVRFLGVITSQLIKISS